MRGFLDPARPVLLNLMCPFESVRRIPTAISIEHQLRAIPESLSQDLDQLHILSHAFRSGTRPVGHKPLLKSIPFGLQRFAPRPDSFRFQREPEATRVALHRLS